MSTKHYLKDYRGNNSGDFDILEKNDKIDRYSQYLMFFHNETYCFWEPPPQFKDYKIGDIPFFLSQHLEHETQFVFTQKDVKYVCTAHWDWHEQIVELRSCFGPNVQGTFTE